MPSLGHKTLKSVRARSRRIDVVFQHIGYALILFYFFFTISAWLSYREALQIDSVEISGAHAVDQNTISAIARSALNEKFLFKINRNNAILYPKDQIIRDTYLLDGRVKSVRTEVSPIKHLTIFVNEYAPKLLACPNMATTSTSSVMCYLGDDEGYIFSRAPDYSGYFFPIFIIHDASLHEGNIIGTYVLPRDEFLAIQGFLTALRTEGFTPKRIEYLGEHDYEIMTERPWRVRWSSTVLPTQSVENLRLVLRSIEQGKTANSDELKMVDLRFGNKIFYK